MILMKKNAKSAGIVAFLLFVFAAVYMLGQYDGGAGNRSLLGQEAVAAENQSSVSPVKALKERDVYYPGSEELAPDEMRIIACGTGMPNARPKQAAACFLVELGNGDKFIFDIGTGSAERLSALMIPYDYLDKVFIGHLHADHFGDLDALWVGGSMGNRQRPLRVWGPRGAEEKFGTKYAVEHLKKAFTWDYGSRQGNVNTLGLEIELNEFDYKGVNQVIYQENGVTIRL
jgi:ribonuclease Z